MHQTGYDSHHTVPENECSTRTLRSSDTNGTGVQTSNGNTTERRTNTRDVQNKSKQTVEANENAGTNLPTTETVIRRSQRIRNDPKWMKDYKVG